MSRIVYDDATVAVIRRLREVEQLSPAAIADRLGYTKGQINGKIQRLGLRALGPICRLHYITNMDWAKVARQRAQGERWSDIARGLGISRNTLQRRVEVARREGLLSAWPHMMVYEVNRPEGSADRSATPRMPHVRGHTVRHWTPPKSKLPLADACQWVVTDGPPWRYCDDPEVVGGTVYCAKHASRAYT